MGVEGRGGRQAGGRAGGRLLTWSEGSLRYDGRCLRCGAAAAAPAVGGGLGLPG